MTARWCTSPGLGIPQAGSGRSGPAIDARYLWQTPEGDIIVVRNAGPFNKLIPTFGTRVDGKYAWMNSENISVRPRARVSAQAVA
jgi:hypothetical protein